MINVSKFYKYRTSCHHHLLLSTDFNLTSFYIFSRSILLTSKRFYTHNPRVGRFWSSQMQCGRGNRGGGGGYHEDPHFSGRGRNREEVHSNRDGDSLEVAEDRHFSQFGKDLRGFLESKQGFGYGVLKNLLNRTYPFGEGMSLVFTHIQSDPFAPGSEVCFTTTTNFSFSDMIELNGVLRGNKALCHTRQVAAEDFLLRSFRSSLRSSSHKITVYKPSQHVLERSALSLSPPQGGGGGNALVNLRMKISLPGHSRRIDGLGIIQILYGIIQPALLKGIKEECDTELLREHVDCVEDQEWLRMAIGARDLVAFVPNGAIIARRSGESDEPLDFSENVPFESPQTLLQTFELPRQRKTIVGMGIPQGLTLICGGGFHGKSTLLRALEIGVYNHIPGDGREYIVVNPSAVKIRAEDKRSIQEVDISPFITNLPGRVDTTRFSTRSASGSTSQAAFIMESLELNSKLLLFDEDTCATNLMYRDELMQELVPHEKEPITTLLDRITQMWLESGISSIMVFGGSGRYFPRADLVLCLQEYHVHDVTQQAYQISRNAGLKVQPGMEGQAPGRGCFLDISRIIPPSGVTFQRGSKDIRIKPRDQFYITVGETALDLSGLEQLVEEGQTEAICMCLKRFLISNGFQKTGSSCVNKGQLLNKVVDTCISLLKADNKWAIDLYDFSKGFTVMPRRLEIGGALNRLRGLKLERL